MKSIKTWSEYYSLKENEKLSENIDKFLFQKLETEYEKAINEIINLNVNTVHYYALKYKWCNIPYEDLISIGKLAIINAANNFDIYKGVKFSTYCTHYIIGRIKREIEQNNNLIKIPAHINLAILRISHLPIDEEEISETVLRSLSSDRYKVHHLKQAIEVKKHKIVNIEDSWNIEEESEDSDLKITIQNALNKLSPESYKAVTLKFGINENKQYSYAEIDKMLKIDSQKVIKDALERLKIIMGGKIV